MTPGGAGGWFILVMGVFLLRPALAATPAPRRAPAPSLIEFELRDQFEAVHRRRDYDGRIVILIGSDKKGSEYGRIWSPALRDSLKGSPEFDGVTVMDVGDMRGIPFFVKGLIKRKLPRDQETRILLDWKGKMARAYGFMKKACNILIFDRCGKLVFRSFVRDLEPERMTGVLVNVRRLLGDPVTPRSAAPASRRRSG